MAISLYLSLPKICALVPPLSNGAEFTLFVVKKRCTLRKMFALFILPLSSQSNGTTGDWRTETSDSISGCTVFLPIPKKWIKLIPKTIGNRKKVDCAWDCARAINTTWENLQIEKHKSRRRSFRSPDRFVLCNLQIFSGGVYPPSAASRTICFFLFPIVFGIIIYLL